MALLVLMVSRSAFDNTVMGTSYSAMTQTPKEQEISISDEMLRRHWRITKRMDKQAIKDAKDSTKGNRKTAKRRKHR